MSGYLIHGSSFGETAMESLFVSICISYVYGCVINIGDIFLSRELSKSICKKALFSWPKEK